MLHQSETDETGPFITFMSCTLLTGDPEFKQVKDSVRIEWLVKKNRSVKSAK